MTTPWDKKITARLVIDYSLPPDEIRVPPNLFELFQQEYIAQKIVTEKTTRTCLSCHNADGTPIMTNLFGRCPICHGTGKVER